MRDPIITLGGPIRLLSFFLIPLFSPRLYLSFFNPKYTDFNFLKEGIFLYTEGYTPMASDHYFHVPYLTLERFTCRTL